MSHQYQIISWNRQKKIYDTVLFSGVVIYLSLFMILSQFLFPYATIETIIIRAFGTAALFLLHIILSIGPLCRLDRRFLPLLYNRRHMGVTMFFLALVHGIFSVVQFHAFGNMNPLASLFLSNTHYNQLGNFPFEVLGFAALVILFLMAATSHDFWLAAFSAPVWKTLHMFVYLAYALIIAHVSLGALQSETNPVYAVLMAVGFIWIISVHLAAAFQEKKVDEKKNDGGDQEGYIEVCTISDIPEKRARIVCLGNERIAVFKYDGKISAVSNVCQHQNGPLGEGKIINCKIVCPWHGYEYNPDDGTSPPPFTEKVSTFNVKIIKDKIFVHPTPNPAGTRSITAMLSS